MSATGDRSDLGDLLSRLGRVEQGIRDLVAARRATDPQPDDPFRGLYLSDDAVDRVLASESEALLRLVESLQPAGASRGDGPSGRLARPGAHLRPDGARRRPAPRRPRL